MIKIKKNKNNKNREDMIKRNKDKIIKINKLFSIIFSHGGQDKIKYKKFILPLIYITVKLIYFKK
jgi:hypothetical protein